MEKAKKLFSEHLEFIVVLLVLMGTFLWGETERRADRREFTQDMKSFRIESQEFHGRMCTLEERYLQLIQNKDK